MASHDDFSDIPKHITTIAKKIAKKIAADLEPMIATNLHIFDVEFRFDSHIGADGPKRAVVTVTLPKPDMTVAITNTLFDLSDVHGELLTYTA